MWKKWLTKDCGVYSSSMYAWIGTLQIFFRMKWWMYKTGKYKTVQQSLFMKFSYETESITGFLEQLKWDYLNQWKKQSRLTLLYKDLKG